MHVNLQCIVNQKLTINWPALSHSQRGYFPSHMITFLIFVSRATVRFKTNSFLSYPWLYIVVNGLNHYQVDGSSQNKLCYPLDSDLSDGYNAVARAK